MRRSLEVNPHDVAPRCRMADLGEVGAAEYAFGTDVKFFRNHVLRGDGVSLDRAGAAITCEVHLCARQGAADTQLSETHAGEDTGHGPDTVVGLFLRSTNPRDAVVAKQARVGGSRLDCAPTSGLA